MTPQQFHDIALSLPHTEPGTSYGEPAFEAFGKFLTRLRAEDDSVVLCQVPFDERDMLCAAEPETFHFTPHYRNCPIVQARLKRLGARRLRGYLLRQWRHNAPRKWLKARDEGTELVWRPAAGSRAKARSRKTR